MTLRIDLVTGLAYPEITASDALLADELARRGAEVRARPWNDPGDADREGGDVVVIRSSWDFHTDVDRYEDWVAEVDAVSTLLNPLELVRWNLRKQYLLELIAQGAPLPRTARIGAGATDVPSWVTGEAPVVVKPLVGASGVGVELLDADDAPEALAAMASGDTELIVQEFVDDVADGEWALVFLGGRYSHAFQRVPVPGEFRVNSGYGGTVRGGDPGTELIALAEGVLELLPGPTVYARVDLMVGVAGTVVMEVEVNEPSICLHLHPDAPRRFADAVLDRAGR
ncbi:MAG: hypothetical protein AAGA90_07340 [Actinomycetota bacterium]